MMRFFPGVRRMGLASPVPVVVPRYWSVLLGIGLVITLHLANQDYEEVAHETQNPHPLSSSRFWYHMEPLPPSEIVHGKPREGSSTWAGQLRAKMETPIKKYFDLLRETAENCRKLVTFGGELVCRNNQHPIPKMDGHKVICVDPEMQLGGRRSLGGVGCLVLSFGVNVEVSFDHGMSDADCEVHMFDIIDFANDSSTVQRPRFHFHKMGLGDKNLIIQHGNEKKFNITRSKLNTIFQFFNFTNRIVNILKIDIEGEEWEVLEDVAKSPHLQAIGQMAIEVHVLKTDFASPDRFKKYTKVLLDLEDLGFKRVSYFDNVQPYMETEDEEGVKRHLAGELLLVNSNWYSEEFRREARANGFQFG